MLKQEINNQLTIAMKARDLKKTTVLRSLLSEIKNKEIDKKTDLTDLEIINLLKKQVKILEDANTMFVKGNRQDLVDNNIAEIKLIKAYLPEEISEEVLEKKVREVMGKNKEETNIGKLIGLCIKDLRELADSSRIAKIVNKLITKN